MRPAYKKSIILLLDIILFVYVIAAMVSFNKPDESKLVCSEVNIKIDDRNANGFLTAAEVKKMMQQARMYPLNFKMDDIKPRQIEDLLCKSPFVKTAECYKTKDCHVYISITQRLPVIRIKSQRGEDYYLDDKGGIMPNSNYTSDLIIATGNINKWFARNYIAPMANIIMANDLWKNLIEQINVLPDKSIEIVPRIGNHIVYLGSIPYTRNEARRKQQIEDFVTLKLTRLEKFYKYGLSQVGWNKYPYISLEFNNQIICKKDKSASPLPVAEEQSAPPAEGQSAGNSEKKAPESEEPDQAAKPEQQKSERRDNSERKEKASRPSERNDNRKKADDKKKGDDSKKKDAAQKRKSADSNKKADDSKKKADSSKKKSDSSKKKQADQKKKSDDGGKKKTKKG